MKNVYYLFELMQCKCYEYFYENNFRKLIQLSLKDNVCIFLSILPGDGKTKNFPNDLPM